MLVGIERALTPEAAGVSSARLIEVFDALEKTNYHGITIVRGGKIAAQWFRPPYKPDLPHAMYSVSKTITATAAGFAVTEGLLSLDSRVIDVLPEYAPKKPDEVLQKLCLKHLISLSSGINPNVAKNKSRQKDWIKVYMKSPRQFVPGEGFQYVNENFHVACAMIAKASGQSVVDFLYPRLFEPLEIKKPFWECGPTGIESGGWGLFLSADDLTKITLCYLNGGVYNGKQVIPAEWVKEATTNHKNPRVKTAASHEAAYGYGIWRRDSAEGPYRFDGMYNQISETYPEFDAFAIVVGGDCTGNPRGCLFEHFPGVFCNVPESDPEAFAELQKRIDTLKGYPPLAPAPRSPLESKITAKRIKFRPHRLLNLIGMPVSVLATPATFMTKDRAGNINNVSLEFNDSSCRLSWSEGDETNTIECGMDGKHRISPMRLASKNYNAYSSAAWEDEKTLVVVIRPIESVDTRILHFTFEGKRVVMTLSTEQTIQSTVGGIKWVLKIAIKSEKLVNSICDFLCSIIEPIHKGRLL